jgi:hypothetical protein
VGILLLLLGVMGAGWGGWFGDFRGFDWVLVGFLVFCGWLGGEEGILDFVVVLVEEIGYFDYIAH